MMTSISYFFWVLYNNIFLCIGFCELVFQFVQTVSQRVRFSMISNILKHHKRPSTKTKERIKFIDNEKLKNLVKSISHGDWFVLYQMSKNLDHKFFVDFLIRLSRSINTRSEGIKTYSVYWFSLRKIFT